MTNSKPLVSVAMATYNGERFLRQQLDSVIEQTYKNLEVIVTDDGSTDQTLAILEEYSHKFGLKYWRNENNLGYARNFERAASLCGGDYIAFCDQDDAWFPRKIETLLNEIGEYSLIYSDATLIDEQNNVLAKSYREYVNLPRLTGKPFKELIFSCYVRGFQMLFTRALLKAALPMPSDITHDDWLCILATRMNGMKFLDTPLVAYRQHGRNVTGILASYSMAREFFGVLKNITNREANKRRQEQYRRTTSKLISLSRLACFDDDDRAFINEVAEYYQDQAASIIHWRSFAIAMKYYNHLLPDKNSFLRFKFLISSLVHP